MKKSLIGTLALGLIIGTGALTVKSFANERTVDTQLFVNKTNPVVSTTDNHIWCFIKIFLYQQSRCRV